MPFFVLETCLVKGVYANANYQRDTLDDAEKEFHTFMGYQIKAEGVTYAMASIVDRNGKSILNRVWDKPQTESSDSAEN